MPRTPKTTSSLKTAPKPRNSAKDAAEKSSVTKQRNTKQRDTIRAVFEDAGVPLSPKEALDRASQKLDGIGMATIYRTIKGLVAEAWLVPVELPGEAPRYELAGKHHHHHFSCTACQRVFEVEGCPEDLKKLTPHGFKLLGHDLLLFGLCAACAAKEPPNTTPRPPLRPHTH